MLGWACSELNLRALTRFMNLHSSLGELILTFPCITKSQSRSVSFGFMFHYRHFFTAQVLKT